jgi:hypothetical protein
MTESIGWVLGAASVIWLLYSWLSSGPKSESKPDLTDVIGWKNGVPTFAENPNWRLEAHAGLQKLIDSYEAKKLDTTQLRQAGKLLYDAAKPTEVKR